MEPPQILLFPDAVDDYVSADNPVRFIDGFVDELDLAAAGIARVAPKAAARPAYAPSDLLKPHIHGYLNRVWSGHQLEIECSHNIEIIWLLAEKVAQIQDPTIAQPQIRKFLELTRKAAQPPLNLPIKDAVEAFLSYAEKRCAPDSTDDWRVMLSEELIHHAKCIRVDAKHGNADAYEPSLLHAEKIMRKIYSAPQMLDAAEPYFTELAAAKPDFSGTRFVSLIQFALKHPNRTDSSRQVERVANLINAYATELHEQYHAAYRLLDQAVTTLAALIPYVHGTAQGVALQNLYFHAYNLIVTRNQVPSDHGLRH